MPKQMSMNIAGSDQTADACSVLSEKLIVRLLIAAHFLVGLVLISRFSIDVDETFTLETTALGFKETIARAITYELQPPLYYALMSLWRSADSSLFVARLFSLLCSTLTLPVLAQLSRRFLPTVNSALVVACAAVSPMLIYVGTENRCYALVLLLSALLLLTYFDGYLTEKSNWRARACLVLLGIASFYTFYFLGFLLAVFGIFLVVSGRWKLALYYVLSMLVVLIAFGPMVPIVPQQVVSHTGFLDTSQPIAAAFRRVAWLFRNMILPRNFDAIDPLGELIWIVGPLALAYAFVVRRWKLFTREQYALLFITASLVLIYVILTKSSMGPTLSARHAVLVFPPMMLCGFVAANAVHQRLGAPVWAALSLVFMVTAVPARYPNFNKPGDWRTLAAYLLDHERPGQPILVYTPWAERGLRYYYRGVNALVPLPERPPDDEYSPPEMVLRSPEQITKALGSLPRNALWFVFDWDYGSAGLEGADVIERFLDQTCATRTDKAFYGSVLVHCALARAE